jgi:hypothetical protein
MARTSLVAACKRKHLLRDGFSAAEELRRSSLAPNPLDLDRALKQDDRRRRLGWSIYASVPNTPGLTLRCLMLSLRVCSTYRRYCPFTTFGPRC